MAIISTACRVDQEPQNWYLGDACEPEPRWHVLWTKSNCEQQVYDQLSAKGFDVFLPSVDKWSSQKGRRRLLSAPLFSSYFFVHHAMDKASYIEISKARGLARILGARWDKLATVPDVEIEAIQRVVRNSLPRMPHPYIKEGQRVRITRGPLANVEGILVQSEPSKGLLVLSVELLRQSLAVQIDCTLVAAA